MMLSPRKFTVEIHAILPVCSFPGLELQAGDYVLPLTSICAGAGDLNSVPHAFVASTVTTKPSPNPYAAV